MNVVFFARRRQTIHADFYLDEKQLKYIFLQESLAIMVFYFCPHTYMLLHEMIKDDISKNLIQTMTCVN